MRLLLIVLGIVLSQGTQAHPRHHYRHHHYYHHRYVSRVRNEVTYDGGYHSGSNVARARGSGEPWCGAFMADLYHITGALGRRLWVAMNWAMEGTRTTAHIGAIVVWRHHVGKIVGGEPGHWLVLSGNDGHQVRERYRSVAGAIAFRDL